MAWRTRPLPSDWPRTKQRILERDSWTCYLCGGARGPGREVDHVVPAWRGGTDDERNLRAICKLDHRDKTAREGQAALAALKLRPSEPHPGFTA